MVKEFTLFRGSQADWCGHRNYRVRLADRHASLPCSRWWDLWGTDWPRR